MTICIFGGTGFLGRHLCERIHQDGIEAFVISRSPDVGFLEKHAPSIRAVPLHEPQIWRDIARVDLVIYLGASSIPGTHWQDPEYEINGNVAAAAATFRRLLDVNPSCHIVYASSGGQIYGPGHTIPIPETCPVTPPTAYALGKYFIEKTLEFFTRTDGAKVTILRLANPVGRWQLTRRHGFISAAMQALFSGRELTIYGDGNNQRDYFDADEFAQFVTNLIDPGLRRVGLYNIGSGRGYTEFRVLSIIEQLTGRIVPYVMAPARSFDLRYGVVDPSRAVAELGWRASIQLDATISKLLKAMEANDDFMRRLSHGPG